MFRPEIVPFNPRNPQPQSDWTSEGLIGQN
jgi:hypothetical protein